jgi:hypothetical protein
VGVAYRRANEPVNQSDVTPQGETDLGVVH